MATSKIVKKIYKDGQEYLIFGSGGAQNGLPDGGTVGQVVKRTATGAEWADESGGIQSSNDTYEDMVHLSQAEYEALENKDPNTFYSTPEDEAEGIVDNTAFGPSWDGVTDKSPSMNAVYDVLQGLETLLANI